MPLSRPSAHAALSATALVVARRDLDGRQAPHTGLCECLPAATPGASRIETGRPGRVNDNGGMKIEEIYLRSVDDLASSSDERNLDLDEYQLLMATATIRRLLFDGTPLAEVLRKRYGVDAFLFRMSRPLGCRATAGVVARFIEQEPTAVACVMSLNDLRGAASVEIYPGDGSPAFLVTVHEMITFLAHIDGGVHLGVPRSAMHVALASIATGHLSAYVAPIARCVVGALQPLTQVVAAAEETWRWA
jgi:hypothetical protein